MRKQKNVGWYTKSLGQTGQVQGSGPGESRRKRDQSDFVVKEEIWDGIIKKYEKQYETGSYSTRDRLSKYLSTDKCSECANTRLNEKSRNIFISNKSISDITTFTTEECLKFFNDLNLKGMKKEISAK